MMKAFFKMNKLAIGLGACCALLLVVLGQEVQTVSGMPQHEVVESVLPAGTQPARNVILMIGDGMGSEHVWAAWLCNKGKLNIENLPVTGFSRTPSASATITDSAAGGTAIACGHKATNGQVGLTPKGKALQSLLPRLAATGRQTGLVVTKAITDATPASFYAHNKDRNAAGEIAGELTAAGCRVVIGGGTEIVSPEQQAQLKPAGTLLQLEGKEHCPPASERGEFLSQSVQLALDALQEHPQGFFLMVEGSQIDTASHDNDLAETVQETLDFDRAVGVVLRWMQKHPDTLLVVTADHQTGGLSILGGSRDKGEVKAAFSTRRHSGVSVPVYATGAGAAAFTGVQENTELMPKILRAAGVKP